MLYLSILINLTHSINLNLEAILLLKLILIFFEQHAYHHLFKWVENKMDLSLALSSEYFVKLFSYYQFILPMNFFQHLTKVTEFIQQIIGLHLVLQLVRFYSNITLLKHIFQPIPE